MENCPEVSEDLKENYVFETSVLEGQCCSEHKMIACKVGERHYKVIY